MHVSDSEREGDEGENEMRFEEDDDIYSNAIAKEGDDRYKNGGLKQKRISSINNLSQWSHDGKVRAGTRSRSLATDNRVNSPRVLTTIPIPHAQYTNHFTTKRLRTTVCYSSS